MIASALLWANAVLYAVFAVWCTVVPRQVMGFLGLGDTARQGFTEFMAVYGGLQAGLAVFFALAALLPAMSRAGVACSLCIYGGVVAWRSAALLLHGVPEDKGIFAVFALEVALLAWSAVAALQVLRR